MVLKDINNLVLVNGEENRLYIIRKSNFITNLKTLLSGKIYVKVEYAFVEQEGIMSANVLLNTLQPIILKDILANEVLSREFDILVENNEEVKLFNGYNVVYNYKGDWNA